jgi:hypothetical protein
LSLRHFIDFDSFNNARRRGFSSTSKVHRENTEGVDAGARGKTTVSGQVRDTTTRHSASFWHRLPPVHLSWLTLRFSLHG